MSRLNRFASLFSGLFRKDDPSRVLIALTSSGPVARMPRDYASFSEEGYKKCVTVFKSVSMVSGGAAGIRWTLYKKARSQDGKRVEIHDHPFLSLMRRPNPLMGGRSFMEAVHAYRLLAGNSYISAVGPKKQLLEDIRELWPVRPDRMEIKIGANGYPAAYIYKLNGRQIEYPVDATKLKSSILHLKVFNPNDDWYGLSPVEPGSYAIDQHNASYKWNLSLLQNSARPSGVLVAPANDKSSGMLTDQQFDRLKKEIEESYTGARNAGKPMLLEGGLDWKQISLTNQQMEFIENKNTSARDIAQVFGVPAQLLGIPGDTTYSNYQEARAALYEETILPAMDYTRDEFNNWILPAFGDGIEADYDKDEIHALAPRRLAVWDKISNATFLTVNEKREAVGYEPREEGDLILVNSTQVSLEQTLDTEEEGDQTGEDLGASPKKPEPDSEDAEDPEDQAEPDTEAGKALEVKLVNLKDARARLREWRGQQRLRKRFEKRLQRQAHATFEVEAEKVADVVEGLDAHRAKIVAAREIDANRDYWKGILVSNLTATSRAFRDRFLNAVKDFPMILERKDAEEEFDSAMREWIQAHAGERIQNITETTKRRIVQAIRDAQEAAYEAGTPLPSFAEAIKGAYDGFSEDRAITIARTETGTAANVSLVEAAKAAEIPGLQKEWIAVEDGRTRDDHVAVNGQMVGLSDSFNVGGFKMAQPLDPNGPPSEVINCRCGVVFSRGEQGE
jgi:HK97 family phage portal protein